MVFPFCRKSELSLELDKSAGPQVHRGEGRVTAQSQVAFHGFTSGSVRLWVSVRNKASGRQREDQAPARVKERTRRKTEGTQELPT